VRKEATVDETRNDDVVVADGEASGAPQRTDAVDDAFLKVSDVRSDANEAGDGDAAVEGDALLDRDRAESFRRRWEEVQTGFVDRPRESVEHADRLVVEVMQQVQASFTLARERLESQWSENDEASTEDLRQALRRYRSFFDRLLGA
jgi:hypothetical protein